MGISRGPSVRARASRFHPKAAAPARRVAPQTSEYTRAHCHSRLLLVPTIGIIHINENEGGIMTEDPCGRAAAERAEAPRHLG
jgi:hypothetical protein